MRVNCSIASIFLFRINILLSSKNIQFSTKTSRVELNDKIKLQKIFRPLYLFIDQYLCSRKILKIFVIHNNINKKGYTFKIVTQNFEDFKNNQKFLYQN